MHNISLSLCDSVVFPGKYTKFVEIDLQIRRLDFEKYMHICVLSFMDIILVRSMYAPL